jgi:WhiB family redox-sensing transcriptional regulator
MNERWRASAACIGADSNLFFPEPGKVGNWQAKQARMICFDCPVRAECLEYALGFPGQPGIWGGTSEKERRTILRNRGRIVSTSWSE